MATLLRLPLSQRQADALAKTLTAMSWAPVVDDPTDQLTVDDLAALREVAEKLKTLREG
jgi:ABC-type sugar transport system ATPase subunit